MADTHINKRSQKFVLFFFSLQCFNVQRYNSTKHLIEIYRQKMHTPAQQFTSLNVLRIRTVADDVTHNGGLVGSRQTSWPPFWKYDIIITNSTLTVNAYLLEEQSCQISSQSNLKQWSLSLLLKSVTVAPTRTSWPLTWHQFKVHKLHTSPTNLNTVKHKLTATWLRLLFLVFFVLFLLIDFDRFICFYLLYLF